MIPVRRPHWRTSSSAKCLPPRCCCTNLLATLLEWSWTYLAIALRTTFLWCAHSRCNTWRSPWQRTSHLHRTPLRPRLLSLEYRTHKLFVWMPRLSYKLQVSRPQLKLRDNEPPNKTNQKNINTTWQEEETQLAQPVVAWQYNMHNMNKHKNCSSAI